MASVSFATSEDQFLCSICLEVFTDPVTTACGHSFCSSCLNKHWDVSESCLCPVCNEEFSSRPNLKINRFMSEMLSELKNKPGCRPELGAAEAGAVVCDVCPDVKLQALKSCLMCHMSFCSLHLQPHHTLPRLQRHQLIRPEHDLDQLICPEHDRPLEFYCRDHRQPICVLCTYTLHKDHHTVPLKEQCEAQKKDLQQKIQERRGKVLELQSSVDLSLTKANAEEEEGVRFFNDIIKSVQQSMVQFRQSIEKKHEEVKEDAEGLMADLQSEISELELRQKEMEEALNSDNHLDYIQFFTSVKPAPELNDWTEVSVQVPSYKGRFDIALSELKIKLFPKIRIAVEKALKQAKKYSVEVTLDPLTAHPNLHLSLRNKLVLCSPQVNPRVDNPQRFSKLYNVLGKEKFSAGQFYFEVQVKDRPQWFLGVTEGDANRKLKPDDLTPENGYWVKAGGNQRNRWSSTEKVGVFVDYDEGLVCFFDTETSTIVDSFTDCYFRTDVLPLLSPGWCHNDKNSAPLILTPVVA
ncbi:unnamed protein product [Knipowitschia caucasica]|uniref:Uncharacterized protein n=1 Tax=Knipowitschia caucasica TaxID=637954 RepID=A0AAV2MM91_KNICA